MTRPSRPRRRVQATPAPQHRQGEGTCEERWAYIPRFAAARMLVEWLVERAERLATTAGSAAAGTVAALCRRARAIGLFVGLWCYRRERGAAGQLANAERFDWPLPPADIDPDALMERIL